MLSSLPCPHLGAKPILFMNKREMGGGLSSGRSESGLQGDFSRKSSHFITTVLSKAVKQRLVVFVIPVLWGAHP